MRLRDGGREIRKDRRAAVFCREIQAPYTGDRPALAYTAGLRGGGALAFLFVAVDHSRVDIRHRIMGDPSVGIEEAWLRRLPTEKSLPVDERGRGMIVRMKWKALTMAIMVFIVFAELLAHILICIRGGLPRLADGAHPSPGQGLLPAHPPIQSSIPLHEYLHPYFGYTAFVPSDTQSIIRLWFPLSQDALSNAFVVGLMGGSVAYQLYQSGGLQTALARHPAVTRGVMPHIIPLCYDGWRQPQPLICMILAQLEGVSFDLIINLDGFNEIMGGFENLFHRVPIAAPNAFMMARLHLLRFEMIDTTTLDCLAECKELVQREHRWLSISMIPPWCFSAFCQLVSMTMVRNIRERIMQLEDQWGWACLGREDDSHCLMSKLQKGDFAKEMIIRYWLQSADAANALCQMGGIPYYHFLQPLNYCFDPRRIDGLGPQDEDISKTRDLQSAYNEMAVIAHKKPFMHDLSRYFAGGENQIFADMCHVNDQGQIRLADAIVKHIASNPPSMVASRCH